MTFNEVCKSHEPEQELHFRHPDVAGTFIFDELGELSFMGDDGIGQHPPLWLSDFDRTDWFLAPIAED